MAIAADPTFGAAGSATFPLAAGESSTAVAATVQADGKVIVVGTIQPSSSLFRNSASAIGVARLNADGSLDTTFGVRGVLTIQSTRSSILVPKSVFLRADGSILVGAISGNGSTTAPTSLAVVVYDVDPNGAVEPQFGPQGFATISEPGTPTATVAVTALADGRPVVLGGTTLADGTGAAVITRLGTNGTPDATFGSGGQTLVAVASARVFFSASGVPSFDNAASAFAGGIAARPDGSIVAAGLATIPGQNIGDIGRNVPFATRLTPAGALDSTFGPQGVVFPPGPSNFGGGYFGSIPDAFGDLVVDASGAILISASFGDSEKYFPDANDIIVDRVAADGSSSTQILGQHSIVGGQARIALLPGGRYDLLDSSVLTRYNADGTVDDTGGGATTIPTNGGVVVAQYDGRVVVAGTSMPSTSGAATSAGVTRYNAFAAPADYDGIGATQLAVGINQYGVFGISKPDKSDNRVVAFGPSSSAFGPVAGDFDGDGKADLAVYSSSDGVFDYRSSKDRSEHASVIGMPGGEAVVGTFGVAVYYPQYSIFGNLPESLTNRGTALAFGIPGQSQPAVADYTGDGVSDLGVYIDRYSVFIYRDSATGRTGSVSLGTPGAGFVPAMGDYDGSGRTDAALYSSKFGLFVYRSTSNGPAHAVQFGPANAGWEAVPGDYDGDGVTDLAVYNPVSGLFAVRPSSGGADRVVAFGPPGNQAVAVLAAGRSPTVGASSLAARAEPARSPVVYLAPMDESGPALPGAKKAGRGGA